MEEIHTDLWGLNNPPSQSESTYTAILICEYIWKTWTIDLQEKDNFVNAFQAWLPYVKAKSESSIKKL